MNDLLIVGDSLAGGLPHLSFPALLKNRLHGWRITSNAAGGDTLAGTGARLEGLLREHRPDALIVEAGTNDILLPALKARGVIWRKLVERIEARGSLPTTTLEEFQDLYSRTLDSAAEVAGRIVVTTIACIGEEMGSALNLTREQYNEAIRETAVELGAALADVGRVFEETLTGVGKQSGFLLDGLSSLLLDTPRCLTPRGADRLSGKRGLVLTIDGVHLNPYGARLYAETVATTLEIRPDALSRDSASPDR
jgi:lysophospholipase L1-like esterase